MKKKSTLSKKLASYSALASAVLMVSKTADAQIIYTDVIPDDTTQVVGSYTMDLNNDGTTDFQFNLIHGATFSGTNPLIDQVRVVGSGSNSILQATINLGMFQNYFYANVLNTGALIGGTASFKNQEILASHSGGYFGSWV